MNDKYHIIISRYALEPIDLIVRDTISKDEIKHLYDKGCFENAISISVIKIK